MENVCYDLKDPDVSYITNEILEKRLDEKQNGR